MRIIRPGSWRWRPDGRVRVWLAIADHFEPLWKHPSPDVARARVGLWRHEWPRVADLCRDSRGERARYTFFFPAEAYAPEFLEPLAELAHEGVAEVEVHYHHGGETEDQFCATLGGFVETLHRRHGLLRRRHGKFAFGFIHGDWALDNSLPHGEHCGLNNEITLLGRLGCYADFTMPSGDSPTQARMVNRIYWAKDDPARAKSYDRGFPVRPGEAPRGELLMIPGPFGARQAGRWLMWTQRYPETGEIASYHRPTLPRVHRWLELAPRIGNDIFVKLYTHGAQERHSDVLLGPDGDLVRTYHWMALECRRRGWECSFVSTWQLFEAVEAIRSRTPNQR
jgi:hypothetical protein